MKILHSITWILLIIGGLNWGLSVFEWDVVGYLPDMLSKIVYVLVGLSAVYELLVHKKNCRLCGTQGMGQTM